MDAIIVLSSSDSDTDRNSDSDEKLSSGNDITKPKCHIVEPAIHTLSDSDSLPELPFFSGTSSSNIYSIESNIPYDLTNFNSTCTPTLASSFTLSSSVYSLKSATTVKPNNDQGSGHIHEQVEVVSVENGSQSASSYSQYTASQESEASSQLSNSDFLELVFSRVLSHEKGFEELKSSLQDANIVFYVEDVPLSGTVFWREKSRPGLVENQILVSNGVDTDTPLSHAMKVLNMYPNCRITYIFFGMEKYFKSHRNCEVQEFRDAISGQLLIQQKQKKKKKNLPRITKIDFEEALIDVQLQANVNFRLIDSMAGLSEIVLSFTKSIIDAPKKRTKRLHNFNWHIHGDTNGSVKVGKSNDGFYELWVQQLLQFHQVSKNTAQTIAAKYPSPQALIKEYLKCGSSTEASKLLQNLEVRRGIGPLASSRRIGPELSFKIHTLLTTTNADEVLHST